MIEFLSLMYRGILVRILLAGADTPFLIGDALWQRK
jgi:hypothetical protein